ncbi:hypothetical protein QP157_19370 [Sphingomonas sp. LR61]
MDLDGRAGQERVQDVALELLHDHHDAEHHERRHPAVEHEGDEHRDRTGDDRPDDGDERAEEHDDADRDRQRDLQGERADGHAEGIGDGDDQLDADEARQRLPAGVPRDVDASTCPAREEPDDPPPDARAVDEHEQRREHDDEQPLEHVHGAGAGGLEPGQDRRGVRLQVVEAVRHPRVDVLRRDPERLAVEQGPQGLHAVVEPAFERRQVGPHLLGDEQRQPTECQHQRHEARQYRRPLRPPVPLQERRHRHEERADQQRDEERHHDVLQQHDQRHQDGEAGTHDEDAPGERRADPQAGGHCVVGPRGSSGRTGPLGRSGPPGPLGTSVGGLTAHGADVRHPPRLRTEPAKNRRSDTPNLGGFAVAPSIRDNERACTARKGTSDGSHEAEDR